MRRKSLEVFSGVLILRITQRVHIEQILTYLKALENKSLKHILFQCVKAEIPKIERTHKLKNLDSTVDDA